MSREQEHEPVTDEKLEAEHAEEIPERAAMSVLGLPVKDATHPSDPPEPKPSDV